MKRFWLKNIYLKRNIFDLKTKPSMELVTNISIIPHCHGTPSVLDHLSSRPTLVLQQCWFQNEVFYFQADLF